MEEQSTGSVGKADRIVRFVLGGVLIGFALFCPYAKSLGDAVVWTSGLVGAVMVATAAMRFCPLYKALGICS